MADSRPQALSEEWAALMEERREALRRRHLGVAELCRQDLVAWFLCVGGVGLVLVGAIRLATSPVLPASVRTTALVGLVVLMTLSVFVFAASAPAMRAWFRAESVRRGILAQRLEQGSHAKALERMEDPGPHRRLVLVLQPPDPADELRLEVDAPRTAGFLPRAGAVSVGPRSRHDPFPEAHVEGVPTARRPSSTHGPGWQRDLPKPAPALPGVLSGLQLFDDSAHALAHVLPKDAAPVGIAALDLASRWRDPSPPWPRVDTLSSSEPHTLAELLPLVDAVVIELSSVRSARDAPLQALSGLGPRLLVSVPPGWIKDWPEGVPRPDEAVVAERGRVLREAVSRWWAGLPSKG